MFNKIAINLNINIKNTPVTTSAFNIGILFNKMILRLLFLCIELIPIAKNVPATTLMIVAKKAIEIVLYIACINARSLNISTYHLNVKPVKLEPVVLALNDWVIIYKIGKYKSNNIIPKNAHFNTVRILPLTTLEGAFSIIIMSLLRRLHG